MRVKVFNVDYLDALASEAARSTRQRQHRNVHESFVEACQRTFIALQPGSYVPPHRHCVVPRDELMVPVRGLLVLVLFDNDGTVTEMIRFGAGDFQREGASRISGGDPCRRVAHGHGTRAGLHNAGGQGRPVRLSAAEGSRTLGPGGRDTGRRKIPGPPAHPRRNRKIRRAASRPARSVILSDDAAHVVRVTVDQPNHLVRDIRHAVVRYFPNEPLSAARLRFQDGEYLQHAIRIQMPRGSRRAASG